MTTGYVRQSSGNIQPGLVANAEDLNAEFNALVSAFDNTVGHDHSGSVSGDGAKINAASSLTGILPVANGGTGQNNGKFNIPTRTTTSTGSQAVNTTDGILVWSPTTLANTTFTLPNSPSNGDAYTFVYNAGSSDAYTMTLQVPAGFTINVTNAQTMVISTQGASVTLVYSGSNSLYVVI